MIEIFDQSRQCVAVTENAYSITETKRMNAIGSLTFSLPDNDPKNKFCQPFAYVRNDGGELYRIMPIEVQADEMGGCTYQCEHVLATLIDQALFGYRVIGGAGIYTDAVIRYLLNMQLVKNWTLSECDYRYQYEYGWENEGLLHALFSVATPFAEPYIWRTDTSVYPWRLSLKRLETAGNPEHCVQHRHNMVEIRRTEDPQQICTRIYPLGYGEGVNQLTIKAVNNGVPYIQSPSSITSKYGIVERVWIDRRYENAESLKATAAVILKELQEPLVSYEISMAELDDSAKPIVPGARVRIVYPEKNTFVDTYVKEVKRDFDNTTQSTITISNRSTDIASTIADLADRQRIEQAYAQGATQVYAQALQANCSSTHGAVMDFFIPSEMRIVNRVLAKIRIGQFRAYSKTTTSVNRGGYTYGITWNSNAADEYGNIEIVTSAAGGVTGALTAVNAYDPGNPSGYKFYTGEGVKKRGILAETPKWDPDKRKYVYLDYFDPAYHAHTHTLNSRYHNHGKFTYPAHQHGYTIPGHWHSFELPAHEHEITPGIYLFGNPLSFSVYIDGIKKRTFSVTNQELDITSLLTGSNGKIPRDKWITLEIRPDSLAYASIVLVVQGFIQSRGEAVV